MTPASKTLSTYQHLLSVYLKMEIKNSYYPSTLESIALAKLFCLSATLLQRLAKVFNTIPVPCQEIFWSDRQFGVSYFQKDRTLFAEPTINRRLGYRNRSKLTRQHEAQSAHQSRFWTQR